jgi:glycogen synthase
MHIGFLTPEYVKPDRPDGGLANYVRKVGIALSERGHQISVLALSDRTATWQDGAIAVYEVKQNDLTTRLKEVRPIRPFLIALTRLLDSRRLAAKVWQIHQQTPFDLLQTSDYLAPGYALRRNDRIPLVCRISYYAPLWRSAYGMQRKFGDHLSDWLELRQVIDADATFAPSQFLADVLTRMECHQPTVLRTPLELPSVETDPSYYQTHLSGLTYLLFFGTLSGIKGVDLLAKVIPAVLANHPDLGFVFVGRDEGLIGGQKIFDYLRSQCQPYEQQLHYHPALPKAQLYPIIANAFGVLMPSRVDNYPNACLEAQSFGIPVIGTDNSSLEEMIVDGETGFLARNGDILSLQQAIARLLSQSPAARQQMQTQILHHSKQILAEDRITQLIEFYQSVCAKTGFS